MTRHPPIISARHALRVVLAAGLLLMLGVNLPGHLSYDSVAQLYEGHFHIRETWGPAIYAWVLGVFDAIIPGTALYVVASGLLFFASLAGLAALRSRVTWLGVAFAALMALTPQVLIYQGIVWKDIAFANTAIAATACLAWAFARWEARLSRWLWLSAALLLMAVASLFRQTGIVVPIMAALAIGWVAGEGQWRRAAAWGGAALLAVLALMQVLSIVAVPRLGAPEGALQQGVRIVQNYDLIGAISLDPGYRLRDIEAVKPAAAAVLRNRGRRGWSPDRVDWLDRDLMVGAALNAMSDDLATRQWLDLIFRHPGLYLRLRWEDFRWVFMTPDIDRCLPVYTGVDAPAEKMRPLGLQHRYSDTDSALTDYDSRYAGTPIHRHWLYALMALIVGGILIRRREPADIAVVALMAASLAFTASFFVISIACDYRYLYMLDLSGLTGLFYLVLDPPGRQRRARPGAAGQSRAS
jgi:hypothetical protein